jgi:hypothetical protein
MPPELELPLLYLVLDSVKERPIVSSPNDGADAFHLA